MSFQAVAWAKNLDCNTPLTKLVLVWLCEYADERNSCYPSEKHLAKLCGVTDRSIRRSLSWLCEKGYVSIQHRTGTSNRYFIQISSMDTNVHPPLETEVLPVRTPKSSNNKDDKKDLILTTEFEKCWLLYPRKVGKARAVKCYTTSIKDVDPSVIYKGLKKYIVHWKQEKTELRYIPHFSTWLSQGRWDDELINEISNEKKTNINWLAG